MNTHGTCLPGVLCTVIGILVVTLNFTMPERMKEAFSVGVDSYEDEGVSHEEGYLNSVFLDGVTTSPLTLKATVVSGVLFLLTHLAIIKVKYKCL